MTLNETLSPSDIHNLLTQLGIDWKTKRPNQDGWITIKSPLREENNPSFGLNACTGAFRDHGINESGDIVTLVEHLKGFTNNEAIRWIKSQTVLPVSDNLSKNGTAAGSKKQIPFWSPTRSQMLSQAQERLKNENNHPVLRQVESYDLLPLQTLKRYKCGILQQYNHDWLAIPYETGCQLYRREGGQKVIRSLRGSSPSKTFFGINKTTTEAELLFIAKSPRETMLLNQLYGEEANIIGLATGEQGGLASAQIKSLKTQISDSSYKAVVLFLDCDTKDAFQTAQELAANINEIQNKCEVTIFNVHKFTHGACKDVTDVAKD